LIVHWPAGIKDGGKLRHTPCHFIDVLPTLVELGGNGAAAPRNGGPALPGKSLIPALRRDTTIKRNYLYFHHANNRAIRAGDHKLVAAGANGPWELYDLRSDRSEGRDLAAAQPDLVQRLGTQWREIDENFVRSREEAKPFPKDAPGRLKLP
jgi:arylsulfatase